MAAEGAAAIIFYNRGGGRYIFIDFWLKNECSDTGAMGRDVQLCSTQSLQNEWVHLVALFLNGDIFSPKALKWNR